MDTSITTDLELCRTLLKEGEVVAIPTETVYGLAANIFDSQAVEKIFSVKKRPRFNPLIVHIKDLGSLKSVVEKVPEKALLLAKEFWPGPLTLILPKKDGISDIITAGKPTVGVRIPNHKTTLELLKGLSFPVAAPSANPFTRISPTSAIQVFDYFGKSVTVLDGGQCEIGLESTIVGFEDDEPVVYRKGGIPLESIEAIVGPVKINSKSESEPVAPGMLLKHYSPRTRLLLTEDFDAILPDFKGSKVGVLSFSRTEFENVSYVKTLSLARDLQEAAKNLFQSLYELDRLNLDVIIAEIFPKTGLGLTINDRLERARAT
ncbi:L-threonylcarbamoyladenylate synthase [Croceivirga thetidis]|uniref:Threonylcarbamoyl-AMP synthase n=1 Tax=Croceivirga thetidis TaxID=2721623 RepID=A0ABX1GP67_9FLAO|nr:L-threonylcarbamoyladenylate synthase [Croceivirga thetidis]NKI30865.1 threonylcarbamoyl-AMP synthase [Croceivirga thetidis]